MLTPHRPHIRLDHLSCCSLCNTALPYFPACDGKGCHNSGQCRLWGHSQCLLLDDRDLIQANHAHSGAASFTEGKRLLLTPHTAALERASPKPLGRSVAYTSIKQFHSFIELYRGR